jgi:hypothetical protein
MGVDADTAWFWCKLQLPKLPGSVAGDCEWLLLTPGRWSFWCFLGCFVAKNPLAPTPTQEVV